MQDERAQAADRADARRPQGLDQEPRAPGGRASRSSPASPRSRSATPATRSAAPRLSARASRCRSTWSARSSSCRRSTSTAGAAACWSRSSPGTGECAETRARRGRAGRLGAPLDGDADEPDVLAGCRAWRSTPSPTRAEFVEQQPRDALGKRLDQVDVLRSDFTDARGDLVVVDAVGDLVAREHRGVRDADLEVEPAWSASRCRSRR